MRPDKKRWGVMAALALLAVASAAEAHRPPPGYALEHRDRRAGHAVEVMVTPRMPRAGAGAEVIVAIREEASGLPYRGYVAFLVAKPGVEAEPLGIPLQFGPGEFESAHVFREPGIHSVVVVFHAGGGEQRVGPIAVEVRPPSRVGEGVALALALVTAVTYVAAFLRSRRRGLPGSRHG